jgi:hypothetical protein
LKKGVLKGQWHRGKGQWPGHHQEPSFLHARAGVCTTQRAVPAPRGGI